MRNKKLLVTTTALVGALTAMVSPVYAQEDAVAEIVITGSRLGRVNLNSPVAVTSVDSEVILATGQRNLGDIIKSLPSAGVSGYTSQSTGFATNGNGITSINLRNLEEDRTLILVNGRRYVAGVVGTQVVDVGNIPAELVDRIDVVTGGASAVYGSDALAGVVNIITKKNFEGLAISAQYGLSKEGDDERTDINLTAGANFAEDKGNATISFGWNKVGTIFARDRANRGMDIDAVNNYDGTDPADIRGQTAGGFSSYSLYGYLDIPGTAFANNIARVYDNATGLVQPYVGATYGYNRQSNRLVQVPTEKLTASAQMNYQVSEWANFFTEFNYAKTTAFSEFEPFPLDSSDLYDENLAFCDDFDLDGDRECQYGIPITSQTVPEAVRVAVRARSPGRPDSDLVIGFRRRISEVDLRGNQVDRQTFRVVAGFQGEIAPWMNYEISANYGRTDDDQISTGDVDTERFAAAVDTILVGGQQVCRDPIARAGGCVPLSIFGLGSITEAAADYVRINTSRDSQLEQLVLNGFVRGDVWEAPAGQVQYVLGAEYRKEKSRDTPDALTQSGQASGNATPETKGQFDVTEVFGELRVPLLADLPYVQSLDLNLAARFSNYSTVGKTEAYAASLEYQPLDWLKARAQYSRAVRAPNISELFQPAQQDFPSVNDICGGVTRSGGNPAFFNIRTNTANPAAVLASGVNASTINDPIAVACLADPAVAARVARDGGFALTLAEDQGVSGFESGNPNLDPEKADTYSFGLIFTPRWAEWMNGLTLSVDYYQIEIEDRIIALEQNQIVQLCYSNSGGYNPLSQFCSPITRFQNGSQIGALQFVDNYDDNFASTKLRGLDAQLSYRTNVADVLGLGYEMGELTSTVSYSHVFQLDTVPFVGAEQQDYIREAGAVGSSRNKGLVALTWDYGPWQVYWQTQIIGKGVIDTNPVGDYYGVELDRELFSDIQVKYDFKDGDLSLYAGVNNVFDNYSFVGGTNGLVTGVSVTQTTGWTTYPEVYDGIGRRGYVGIRAKF